MPVSPSSMPYPTRLTSEPPDDLIEKVVRRLQTTGELMRLTAYIPGRLSELGWCHRVLDLAREYLRNHSASGPGIKTGAPAGSTGLPEPSDIPIQEMVEVLTPQAKIIIPDELYKELRSRMVDFIQEQNID
ncbi:Enhancer of yellow 2 transcription factor [Fasciola gigantica]|uniref:Enhancer of yellow 2 transcription factor n=1 Tax=Fasciola gigantica TaxID=46835 RepID=A0A504YRY6_FASGI|nr:Enhancer of yellow 2 transcription factor [Fasciola gigantica]